MVVRFWATVWSQVAIRQHQNQLLYDLARLRSLRLSAYIFTRQAFVGALLVIIIHIFLTDHKIDNKILIPDENIIATNN